MLTCKVCGGSRIISTEEIDVFVCRDCGCQYSLIDVQRMTQGCRTIPESLLTRARAAVPTPAVASRDFEIVGGVLKAYRGQALDVTVPAGVAAIGDEAFKDLKGIRSVTLPDGVTEIGKHAFAGCERLAEIRLPAGLRKIGVDAFGNCRALQHIDFPDSVAEIGACAFFQCASLQSIELPESLTRIDNRAFVSCVALQSVRIPDRVTAIGEAAFRDCQGLQSVTLPKCLRTIGRSAFINCLSLRSVTIPEGVTEIEIGFCAFHSGSELQSLWIPDSFESWDEEAADKAFFLHVLRKVSLPRRRGMPDASVFPNAQVEYRDKAEEEQLRLQRRRQGLCEFCGGAFQGLFSKTCSRCGRKKSY